LRGSFRPREKQVTNTLELEVESKVFLESLPGWEAELGKLDVDDAGMAQSDSAAGTDGLFRTGQATLDEKRVGTRFGEVIRTRQPDDPTADNHDVVSLRRHTGF
jgi:hypothetical protein